MSHRVLFADPDEDLLEAFQDYFEGQGFCVAVADTGPACIEAIKSFRPQLLVLEPDFPAPWIQRILDALQAAPLAACVPVIVLTRHDHTDFAPPVCRVFTKPIPLSRLTRTIRKLTGAAPRSPLTPTMWSASPLSPVSEAS